MAILIAWRNPQISKHKLSRALEAVLLFTLLPWSLQAEIQRIVGPGGGGAMFHVTISPHDPKEVMLSCDMTGAYISHDGGHKWRMFNLRGTIRFFAFDPVKPHTLYAANNLLWRSIDNGETWRVIWPLPSAIHAIRMDSDHADESVIAVPDPVGQIIALAIDSTNSRMLYAAAIKDNQSSLVFSRDGGIHWTLLRTLPEAPLRIWIDPGSRSTSRDLYIAAPHSIQARLHGSWQNRTLSPDVTLSDVSIGFTHSGLPTLYGVAQSGTGILSLDGGVNWKAFGLPGKDSRLRAVATSLHHPEIAYASYSHLQLDGQVLQGIARTTDSGRTWTLVWRSTGNFESPNVHDAWITADMTPDWTEEPLSLTVDEHNPDITYATDLGRTLATTDGGTNWTARYATRVSSGSGSEATWNSTGLDVTTTYGYLFDPFDSRRRFILTTDIGLFRSEDAGRSWTRSVDGVPGQWRNTTYSVVFDPSIPGKMWAAMSDIHDLPRPKMWRRRSTSDYIGGICLSTDGGRTWRSSAGGLPSTAPTHILLDPSSPPDRRTLWAATMGYGVYRSDDDGRTWSAVNRGISGPFPLAWRLSRSSNGSLYAVIARRSEDGSIGTSNDGALYRSDDRGDSWTPIVLPNGANGPNGLAVDPSDPHRLYLALWARTTPDNSLSTLSKVPREKQITGIPTILNGAGGGIAMSIDEGRTWRWVLEQDHHIYDVTIDPRDPTILYAAGFESSAWISRDRGEQWKRIPGFNFKWGHRVQPDPEDSDKVYVTTFGGGVWHISLTDSANRDIATPQLEASH